MTDEKKKSCLRTRLGKKEEAVSRTKIRMPYLFQRRQEKYHPPNTLLHRDHGSWDSFPCASGWSHKDKHFLSSQIVLDKCSCLSIINYKKKGMSGETQGICKLVKK